MSEEKVKITIEEMKLFDAPKRIREALEGLEKEFEEYKMEDVTVGVELGFPSGVKGSLSVKFSKGNEE